MPFGVPVNCTRLSRMAITLVGLDVYRLERDGKVIASGGRLGSQPIIGSKTLGNFSDMFITTFFIYRNFIRLCICSSQVHRIQLPVCDCFLRLARNAPLFCRTAYTCGNALTKVRKGALQKKTHLIYPSGQAQINPRPSQNLLLSFAHWVFQTISKLKPTTHLRRRAGNALSLSLAREGSGRQQLHIRSERGKGNQTS